MTYVEWFKSTTSRFNISQDDIDLIIVNQGLEDQAHDDVDVIKAKTALCHELATIIPLANVSEGGYSISWNMEALKLWYQQTCSELGIVPASTPKVRNRSNKW